jgi:transcriptional antiterminator RfaH
MTERWHLIATEPRRERYAAAELEQSDFATHLPLVLEPVRQGRRTIDERRPLFPGYVFARFDPAEGQWGVIYRTKGCIAPVRIAGAAGSIPAGGTIAAITPARSARRALGQLGQRGQRRRRR